MNWTGIGMIAFMSLSPFPFALLSYLWQIRNLTPEQRARVRAAVRPGLVRLGIVNAVVVAGIVVWLILDWDAFVLGRRSQYGLLVSLGSFHGLWWPFAAPVLHKLDRVLRACGALPELEAPGRYRFASLTPRTVSSYLPVWWVWVLVASLFTIPVITLARLVLVPHVEARLVFGALFMTATGMIALIGFPFFCRLFLFMRPPISSFHGVEQTAEMRHAMDAERRRWVRLWFGTQLASANIFMIGGLLFAEVARGAIRETTAGLIGGGLGAALGIAGGIIGAWFGHRLSERLRALNNRQRPAVQENQTP
jgi:hypothetical protein